MHSAFEDTFRVLDGVYVRSANTSGLITHLTVIFNRVLQTIKTSARGVHVGLKIERRAPKKVRQCLALKLHQSIENINNGISPTSPPHHIPDISCKQK